MSMSTATCSRPCWEAKEQLCICSCNGRNHGIAFRDDGDMPNRLKQRNGLTYVLYGIVPTYRDALLEVTRLKDQGYNAHCAKASDSQLQWPEFWLDERDRQGGKPYGIWVLQKGA